MTLELEKTDDILKYLGEHKKEGQFLCGFSMETEHMLENSRAKLKKKNLDMIVANNLKQAGAGFRYGHQCDHDDHAGGGDLPGPHVQGRGRRKDSG